MSAKSVHDALLKLADKRKAKVLSGFFKTGPGEYGEGDVFLGVTVPRIRKIVLRFLDLPFSDIKKLLKSPVHEKRLTAVLMLVARYRQADARLQAKIFDFYVSHLRHVNNWDLVDASAHWIVGAHRDKKDRTLLRKLARSPDLWERRVAIVATWHSIRRGDPKETYRISKILLHDSEDLIHKAVGWMLRETGKHGPAGALEDFLETHATVMPRTMLRYAIERFPEKKRQAYLNL